MNSEAIQQKSTVSGRLVQSGVSLTVNQEAAGSRRADVSFWRKYVH